MNNDDNNEDLDDVNYSIDFDPEPTPGSEQVETEGVLSYAFDHIYAITPENAIRSSSLVRDEGSPAARLQDKQQLHSLTASLSTSQTEVQKLKSLISAHLDLIQKQSDIIASKDKQVKACIVENELLKKRLERCGETQSSHLSVSDSLFASSKTQVPFFDTLSTSPDSQSFSLPFSENFIPSDPSTSGHFYSSHTTGISGKMKSHEQPASKPSGRHSSGPQKSGSPQVAIGCKTAKSGKMKTKTSSLQYSTTIPYSRPGNLHSPNNRKRSTESYIKKNYKLEKTTNSDGNLFRKIETSCRDFSYGETISNIGTNILSNIERANNAPSEDSALNVWHNDEAVYKKIDIMGITSLVNVADIPLDIKKEHGKGKGKKSKKVAAPTLEAAAAPRGARTQSSSDAIIRSMFLADLSAEQLPEQPKTLDKKKDCENIYDCDNSESVINLDNLPKKEDIQKRGTSPSASVYSFNEDSQDTKVGNRKASEPRLSVTESLNRMGKRRSRAFGVFGDSGNEEKPPTNPPSNGRKRAQSTSSRVSTVSQAESTCSMLGIPEGKILFKNKSLSILSATDPYHTSVGAAVQPEKQEPINSLEVPKWRIHRIQPQTSHSCENEENVDDTIFNKRHSKMESEERRIKRWDLQRLKVLHLKKAKDRKEKVNSGGKKIHYGSFKSGPAMPDSLWQSTENVLAIEVTDDLPVTSFGELVPLFKPRKFHLPWIPRQRGAKKSKCHRLEKKNKGKEGEDHYFFMNPLRF